MTAREKDVLLRYFSRRRFLRASAIVAAAGPMAGRVVSAHSSSAQEPFVLRPEAEYRREAAEFETAIREFRTTAAGETLTDAGKDRRIALFNLNGPRLNFASSWKIARLAEDPAIRRWAQGQLTNQTAIEAFLARLEANPRSVDDIPGVTAKVDQLRSILRQAKEALGVLVSPEILENITNAMVRERREAEAAWMSLIAVALVAGSSFGAGVAVTSSLRLTMPDFAAIDAAYQQCVRSVQSLSAPERRAAMLECQARWLASKSQYLV
jgi:hypothetical protein